jgi:hypothetical protein
VGAFWLLLLCLFLGPAGIGGSAMAAAALQTSGAPCPCEGEAHHGHEAGHEEHAEADPCDNESERDFRQGDSEPCQDGCPDGCPDCGCCVGIAMAVVLLPAASGAPAWTSARWVAPVIEPARGARSRVFRPPRSPA